MEIKITCAVCEEALTPRQRVVHAGGMRLLHSRCINKDPCHSTGRFTVYQRVNMSKLKKGVIGIIKEIRDGNIQNKVFEDSSEGAGI